MEPHAPGGPPPASPPRRVVSGGGRIRREVVDPDALHVVARLQEAGHEAYLVGGCVRDLLLGLEPKDFDVATDAPPNRIKRLFRQAFVIGRRFRLVHVRFPGGKVVEAATFRRDPGEQGLHPDRDDAPIYDDNVFGTAVEDAFRRDFTVNALFYDPSRDEVIDHVGGLADLEARVIRAIGDPVRRLCEDPVRMTRAVHFAARIGGSLEPSLRAATVECAAEIAKSSGSRLYAELMKILARGSAAATFRSLFDLGVLEPWLPDLGRFLRTPILWPEQGGGTHEAASLGEPADTPPTHLTWNLLAAADAWGMGARGVPESLELAVLLGPWILSEWERGRRLGSDVWTHVEELIRPMALRMNMPRRTSYELREILGMQSHLREPPDRRRRLRSVVERPIFPEALAYHQLELRARGHDLAPIAAWRAMADEVWAHERRRREAPAPHAPMDFEPGSEDGPVRDLEEEPLVGDAPRTPRRRRGGRGRGRRAAAPANGPGDVAEIFADASTEPDGDGPALARASDDVPARAPLGDGPRRREAAPRRSPPPASATPPPDDAPPPAPRPAPSAASLDTPRPRPAPFAPRTEAPPARSEARPLPSPPAPLPTDAPRGASESERAFGTGIA